MKKAMLATMVEGSGKVTHYTLVCDMEKHTSILDTDAYLSLGNTTTLAQAIHTTVELARFFKIEYDVDCAWLVKEGHMSQEKVNKAITDVQALLGDF